MHHHGRSLSIFGALMLVGCGTLKLEMIQPRDVVRWQGEIGQAVNTHTKQICELQRQVFGICTSETGGTMP